MVARATVDAKARASDDYKKVRDLHAEFHKAAAEVAKMAETGRATEAQTMVNSGRYANVSAQLTGAMMEWKRHV